MIKKNNFIHNTAIIDDGVVMGNDSKIWHFSHIGKNAKIGQKCTIGQNVYVSENVKIGSFVKIQNNVSIYEGVELHDFVFCGPSMVFTNIIYPRSEFPQNSSKLYKKTIVKKSASIGANATVLCGITIGKYSLIGAGSVVVKDVPDFALIIGNPGQIVGWVNKKGSRLNFNKNGKSECGKYTFDGKTVTLLEKL
jgi:UDP-2-acetamido-3-amino-2,3-dideoxy-glucuronate N-acetyltransferase